MWRDILSLVVVLATPQTLYSTENLCASEPTSTINENLFSDDGKTHLQADKVEANDTNTSFFTGDVIIQQKDKRIKTDFAEYEKESEDITAKGNVEFITSDIQIKSETAHVNLKTNTSLLQKAEYKSLTSRARGHAETININSPSITELTNATYTTCEADNVDWLLSATKLTLDNQSHQGYANNLVVRFKDVPFFYFPYLRFPIGEERLSGFLFPYIGGSDEHGTEFKIPYYWNIHPQVDATIIPWFMSKRGTLLHTEFRYLTKNNKGSLTTEFLNDDKVFKDNRERWKWVHESTPSLGWQAKAEYNHIADISHLIDFDNDLTSTSATYLVRTGDISYNMANWLLNLKAEDHQILSGAKPYKRLPQLTLNSRYAEINNAFNYSFQSEVIRFEHDDNKVIGERLHLKPMISYPIKSSAGFFVSKLSLQHTEYQLEQTAGKSQLSRTVPTFSLNSGLFFDRDSKLFNTDYVHSLEPQLFYTYSSYQDQSAFPVFDTTNYAFNVNTFFTDYRFNGIDRIGDDNRLTTALTTRFVNQQNGRELFMARIGEIFYFSDRQVQLPGQNIETSSSSHIITEVKFQPSSWNISSQVEWDKTFNEKIISSNQLGYQYKSFNINLAHRYQFNSLETREAKMNWQLNSRWNFSLSNLYDIRNEHIVEDLYGVNYESCCWKLNLSAKERYINNTQIDRGIYLEFTLKGLGGLTIKQ